METTSSRFGNLSPLKQALLALEDLQRKVAQSERVRTEPVAIIGMGCRLPHASDPLRYWRLLRDGVDAVGEVPASRWRTEDYYDPNPDAPGKMSTKWGGFLDDIDRFDPEFFGISPREAANMDPQQRLLLEVVWEVLENAGQGPRELVNCRTGVFVGITGDEYAQEFYRADDLSAFNAYFASGIARSVAGGRISYTLGIQGPNLSIDTACSSSLVAVHTACLYLRMGECRLALAGGVNVILAPEISIAYSRSHMMAADGRCKAFDSRADGFVRAEGCGMVALKRLSDALEDGDRILAIIRGSAINQDGRSSGLTVPSLGAQQAVLRQALAHGGVKPEEIGYVEAHGTGTALGDPIEARALASVLGVGRTKDNPLVVGSVKANLGHLESAAGIAGLIKTVLALENEEIPPQLHFREMNPHIDWGGMPVEIPLKARPWPAGARKRLAGVSAFGFSGTNAHVVVEEAPLREPQKREIERPMQLLALSARSETALKVLAEGYAAELQRAGTDLGDICYTANAGRAHFEHRLRVVAASPEEMRIGLLEALPGGRVRDRDGIRAAFLFPGQGAQYPGMGKQLYDAHPEFRRTLEECAGLLKGELEEPLLEVLWGARTDLLDETRYTQPALFAVEYAVAQLWRSWGIEPAVVLGHSVGEYVAACVAGVYSLADGVKLIARRGRLMQAVGGRGAMTAVMAGEQRVREAMAGLEEQISIAALNGPESVVVSGYEREVREVEERLSARGVRVKRLKVSHGFHSAQMAEMEEAFQAVAREITFAPPRLELISSVTGRPLKGGEPDPVYWRRQVRQPVRFAEALDKLRTYTVFIESGPGTTLTGIGRRNLEGNQRLWVTSMQAGRGEWNRMLDSLGQLYMRGAEVNWQGYDAPYSRRKVALPTYPFERQRYWIAKPAAVKSAASATAGASLLGPRCELADSGTIVWESQIGPAEFPYLADHRAFGTAVVPLTAYLEMFAAAVGGSAVRLEGVTVSEPLMLPAEGCKTVQVIRRGDVLKVFSRDGDVWKQHVEASAAQSQPAPAAEPLARLRERIRDPLAREEFYTSLKDRGMDFGAAFRGIHSLWAGRAEALAYVVPESPEIECRHDRIHPALLDACCQALGGALPATTEDLYLPFGMEQFELYRSAGSELWSHVARRSGGAAEPDVLLFDIRVFDTEGLVAEVRGMKLRRVAARPGKPMFAVRWDRKDRPGKVESIGGEWLILADRGGIGAGLAERMSGLGAQCTVLSDGPCLAPRGVAWKGVVYLRALDAPATETLSLDSLAGVHRLICGGALELVQSLTADGAPRLWLVTRGAQAVSTGSESIAVAQTSLWGMAQAITDEHPEFGCRLIDLDPGSADGAAHLLDEIAGGDGEDQIAFRGGRRFVSRFIAHQAPDTSGLPVRLNIHKRGVIDNLILEPSRRQPVPPGWVEIQVDASGLNFRDVLNVLGMFSGPLGSECAGRIVAIGAGVEGFHIGGEVIALAFGSHEGFALADARLVAPKPGNLTVDEAATLPTAFLTARYTLEHLAHLRAGQRVLIHSAAGGVGLAAVAIAQRIGAEVFATAGSERKRAYLQSLGVTHVMSSRTLDFAGEILDRTGGQGIDVVLNSLTGDFIPASLSALAPGGIFIEIGKRDIWTHQQVGGLGKNHSYHVVDLGKVAVEEPEILGRLLADTATAISDGRLRRVPVRVFPCAAAAEAFRYMAQAQHIGKIALRQAGPRTAFLAKATYLISGGHGALGLRLAKWLVERGARNIVLVGRRETGPDVRSLIDWADGLGARMVSRRGDVSSRGEMEPIFAEIAATMPPLRGVVHTAAVLDDGILGDLNWERFERVLTPKARGAWLLHELTAALPLDFFVLFSSVASLIGAPGQANYGAANAFEDGLAHERRRQGLPAISINWGAWAGGMAMRKGLAERQRQLGLGSMSDEEGLALLGTILGEAQPQVAAGIFNWNKFAGRYPQGAIPPRFSTLVRTLAGRTAAASGQVTILDRLKAAPDANRMQILQTAVESLARRVLSIPPDRAIEAEQPLNDLGMDSLMALEFRNALAAEVRQSLPTTLLFSHPTLGAITGYLGGLLLDTKPVSKQVEPRSGPLDLLAAIEGLSDEEVDRKLTFTTGAPK